MTVPHFTGLHSAGEASGPFSFLNPTTRRFALPPFRKTHTSSQSSSQDTPQENGGMQLKKVEEAEEAPKDEILAEDVHRKWRSRDNRKGRHAIIVTPAANNNPKYITPPSTSTLKATLKGILRMFTCYPYWDVSWLVAFVFTWGSVVWVINSFFSYLPLQDPSTEFSREESYGGGWTAFIGATIFEFGSVLLMLEAVNENRADCFGWALEKALEDEGLLRLEPESCTHHHHQNKNNFVGKGNAERKPSQEMSITSEHEPTTKDARTWTWWPTWHELTTHYCKELGFLACSSQMFGATVFWISGFTALPEIQARLTTPAAINGAFWAPQVIGGSGFIVSGTLFMLETQQKWYLPAFTVLGWHIGIWNLVGGIGFTLCGALGFASANSGAVYQSALATFWGSWCFLVGSAIQLYESLDKHPVDVEIGGGRVSDTQPVA